MKQRLASAQVALDTLRARRGDTQYPVFIWLHLPDG